ncbi:hypothetical protein [Hymenobacter sp. IS2118]|uniref:hypothetical protein n=1 Tax=Hymenobacter sp. IS2118 TaxID=1505605 RepID=UPI00054E2E09|nr:hypothetical protein [Hymenobacter sp. IS2118]
MDFLLKQARLLLLGLFVLTGCHDKSSDTAQRVDESSVAPDSANAPLRPTTHGAVAEDAVAQQLKALLGGAWLNTTYTAQLLKTHSPRKAHGYWGASGITVMLIDPTSFEGDSLAVALGFSNHEGMPLRYVHLSESKSANSWRTTSYAESFGDDWSETSLRYQTHNADTLLHLDQRNKKTGRIITTTFRRVRGASGTGAALQEPPLQAPLARFINDLLFTGTHSMTDSAGLISSAHFTPSGNVKGLPSHKSYEVNTDFTGPFHEFDTVFLDIYQKSQEELAFATKGDTIRLFAVHDDTTSYERQRGHLRYTLIRQSRN